MALSLCRTTVDDSARELMEHGTAAFPIACYHDDLQAEPVPWHWHEELEVLVVSEGMILATAGGEKFRLGKGEGLFILPQCSAGGDQTPHRIIDTRAEQRMMQLKYGEGLSRSGNLGLRKDIARRVADAVDDAPAGRAAHDRGQFA